MLEINTKNILFIAGGAFVGMNEIIKNRTKGTVMGFNAEIKNQQSQVKLSDITPDDLVKFGMIPEFIGRFTTTVSINDLSKEDLIKVLTEVKNNYIDQYKYLFSIDGIELEFDNVALEQIAENCLKLKTGARGLHTEIERVLMPHMFSTKKYRENNKEKITEYDKEYRQTEAGRKSHRINNWKQYGIIRDDWDALYNRYLTTLNCEDCNCELVEGRCGANKRCLDHDHTTGEVRGIVCNTCNLKRK